MKITEKNVFTRNLLLTFAHVGNNSLEFYGFQQNFTAFNFTTFSSHSNYGFNTIGQSEQAPSFSSDLSVSKSITNYNKRFLQDSPEFDDDSAGYDDSAEENVGSEDAETNDQSQPDNNDEVDVDQRLSQWPNFDSQNTQDNDQNQDIQPGPIQLSEGKNKGNKRLKNQQQNFSSPNTNLNSTNSTFAGSGNKNNTQAQNSSQPVVNQAQISSYNETINIKWDNSTTFSTNKTSNSKPVKPNPKNNNSTGNKTKNERVNDKWQVLENIQRYGELKSVTDILKNTGGAFNQTPSVQKEYNYLVEQNKILNPIYRQKEQTIAGTEYYDINIPSFLISPQLQDVENNFALLQKNTTSEMAYNIFKISTKGSLVRQEKTVRFFPGFLSQERIRSINKIINALAADVTISNEFVLRLQQAIVVENLPQELENIMNSQKVSKPQNLKSKSQNDQGSNLMKTYDQLNMMQKALNPNEKNKQMDLLAVPYFSLFYQTINNNLAALKLSTSDLYYNDISNLPESFFVSLEDLSMVLINYKKTISEFTKISESEIEEIIDSITGLLIHHKRITSQPTELNYESGILKQSQLQSGSCIESDQDIYSEALALQSLTTTQKDWITEISKIVKSEVVITENQLIKAFDVIKNSPNVNEDFLQLVEALVIAMSVSGDGTNLNCNNFFSTLLTPKLPELRQSLSFLGKMDQSTQEYEDVKKILSYYISNRFKEASELYQKLQTQYGKKIHLSTFLSQSQIDQLSQEEKIIYRFVAYGINNIKLKDLNTNANAIKTSSPLFPAASWIKENRYDVYKFWSGLLTKQNYPS